MKRNSKTKTKSLNYLDKKTPFWKPFLFMLPALVVLGFFTIYPFYLTIGNALHPLANKHVASSGHLGLSAFTDVFENHYFQKSLSNSLIYAIITVPLAMIISIVISAAIASVIRKRARGAWQTLFFLPYITSGVAISLAFAYLFNNDTGIINSVLGIKTQWLTDASKNSHTALFVMIVRGIWGALAFHVLIFTTAMLGVDKDRYKAASIDGAGPIRQFFSITLPSIKRTTNFIITVGLIGAVKVFPLALFDMDPGKAEAYGGSTLMLFVFKNVSEGHFQAAGASAIILVAIAIAFSVVVKNSFNMVGKLITKGGEWSVERKIKAKGTVKS